MSNYDDQMIQKFLLILLEENHIAVKLPESSSFSYASEVANDIQAGLLKRLTTVVTPAISELFLEFLNDIDQLDLYLEDPDTAELSKERSEFLQSITSEQCAVLQEQLPVLMDRISDTAAFYQQFLVEFHERMEQALSEISSVLLKDTPIHQITHLRIDSGDSHQCGRTTMVVEMDAGFIVYKPHDVQIDQKSYELIEALFSDVMKAPKVVVGEGFGFCEYIKNQPSGTPDGVTQYIHNLGGMSAVVLMLGSDDLHHNNILASDDKPVIIDYELMITPGKGFRQNSIAYELSHSLLFSSLMPSRRGHIEMSVLFAVDEDNRSAPVINGVKKCILDDKDVFLEGFRQIYRRCMNHRDELLAWAESLQGVSVRHIYRGTRVYHELRQRMLEPNWLKDPCLEETLYKHLSQGLLQSGASNVQAATKAETTAILRGDIPYFYLRADGYDLYAEGEIVYPNFFPQSCIEHLYSRIQYLSEADLSFEEALIEKALTHVIRRYYGPQQPSVPVTERKTCSNERILKEAERIFSQLVQEAVVTPSGNLCWFGPDYYVENGMELLDNGLIRGTAGLAVFFAAMTCMSRNPHLKDQALQLISSITARLRRQIDSLNQLEVIYPNTENLSYSNGLAGKLLACHLIGMYLNDASYQTICASIFEVMKKCDLTYADADVFKGLAGVLLVLCRYDELYQMDGVPAFCNAIADRLLELASLDYQGQKLWKTLSNPYPISGAGHGQSGIGAALYTAGKRLHRKDLLEGANRCFAFEAAVYSPKIKSWPDRRRSPYSDTYLTGYCSGAPGIGMQANRICYEGSKRIVHLALESVKKEPLQYKDFLCCGNCAAIDFLLQAGEETEARSRMAYVLDRAGQNGHYNCMTPAVTDIFSPSLFYGVAGIGYELLRLVDPETIQSIYL